MSLSECKKVKQQTYSEETSVSQRANYKVIITPSLLVCSGAFSVCCSVLILALGSHVDLRLKRYSGLSTPWLPPLHLLITVVLITSTAVFLFLVMTKSKRTCTSFKPARLCWQGIECQILAIRWRVQSCIQTTVAASLRSEFRSQELLKLRASYSCFCCISGSYPLTFQTDLAIEYPC